MKSGKHKQIAAIVCIVLMVLVYVAALIAALVDKSAGGLWFKAAILATIILPVMTWIYLGIYGLVTGKKTIADMNLMQDKKNGEPLEKSEEEPVKESGCEESSSDADA